jgi:hypothetical protein
MQPDHNAIRIITDSLIRLATVERLRREADVLSDTSYAVPHSNAC